MAWRGNDQLEVEIGLGGFRSSSGKNKQDPQTMAMLERCPFGLQAGLCRFEGFLYHLYSKPAWVTELWQNYHWFCSYFFLKIFGILLFLEVDFFSWPTSLYSYNIGLKRPPHGVSFRRTSHSVSWSSNNLMVLGWLTPSPEVWQGWAGAGCGAVLTGVL